MRAVVDHAYHTVAANEIARRIELAVRRERRGSPWETVGKIHGRQFNAGRAHISCVDGCTGELLFEAGRPGADITILEAGRNAQNVKLRDLMARRNGRQLLLVEQQIHQRVGWYLLGVPRGERRRSAHVVYSRQLLGRNQSAKIDRLTGCGGHMRIKNERRTAGERIILVEIDEQGSDGASHVHRGIRGRSPIERQARTPAVRIEFISRAGVDQYLRARRDTSVQSQHGSGGAHVFLADARLDFVTQACVYRQAIG